MTTTQHHVIDRQILELVLEGGDIDAVQNSVRRSFHERVAPSMAVLFDSMVEPDRRLCLERLVIDLGRLREDQLDDRFADLVADRLQSALEEWRQSENGGEEVVLDHLTEQDPESHHTPLKMGAASSMTSAWDHFMVTGRWPWWVSRAEALIPSVCLDKLLENRLTEVLARVREYVTHPRSLDRLILQVHDPVLEKLVRALAEGRAEAVLKQRLKAMAVRRTAALDMTGERLRHWRTAILAAVTDGATCQQSREDRADSQISNQKVSGAAQEQRGDETTDSVAFSAGRSNTLDRLHLDNGGLVLLWPFLSHFFARVGLIENRAFRDKRSAVHAACLLRFLVTGETETPEPVMTLEKILCGLDLDESLPGKLDPTPEEAAETAQLIEVTIARWPALKSISNEGFRVNWLQREALLSPHPDGWLLQIEHRPADILLDRLPWPLGQIRLPWTTYILAVVW